MTPLTKLSVMLVAVAMLGSACAFTTAQVDLGYAPEAGEKGPLGTLKPMMVRLQVEDQREAAERDQVGNKRNGFGTITAPVKSNKDVLGIVAEALKNEFQSGGHNVSTQDSGTPDVIVRVALKKYWSDMTIKFFEIEMLGTMNAKVAIERPREPREVGAKDINTGQVGDVAAETAILPGAPPRDSRGHAST